MGMVFVLVNMLIIACIDGLASMQRKLISWLRGRLYKGTNTIVTPYVSSPYFLYEYWSSDTSVFCPFKNCGR